MMEIGVTGSKGFIGKHLVKRLREDGHVIREFLGDIRDEGSVGSLVGGCDVVFHLAAVSDVRYAESHHKETIDVNVGGTFFVARAAARTGARLIFTSSSAVYGDGPVPFVETQKCQPISIYGMSKPMARYDTHFSPMAAMRQSVPDDILWKMLTLSESRKNLTIEVLK